MTHTRTERRERDGKPEWRLFTGYPERLAMDWTRDEMAMDKATKEEHGWRRREREHREWAARLAA